MLLLTAITPLAALEKLQSPDDGQIIIDGIELHLFGTGIRNRFLVDVYECSIYIEKADPVPDNYNYTNHGIAVRIRIIVDNLPKTPPSFWLNIFRQTLDRDDLQTVVNEFSKLEQGDTLTLFYHPGKGTRVYSRQSRLLKNTRPDLITAVIDGLIGSTPVSAELKRALLKPVN